MILKLIYDKFFKFLNILKLYKVFVKIIIEWVYNILFFIIFIKLINQYRLANSINKRGKNIFTIVLIGSEKFKWL